MAGIEMSPFAKQMYCFLIPWSTG